MLMPMMNAGNPLTYASLYVRLGLPSSLMVLCMLLVLYAMALLDNLGSNHNPFHPFFLSYTHGRYRE